MVCAICEIRKPRRYCPGVKGDICAQCCGTEREVTVHCPFDCPYLETARAHEKMPDLKAEDFPNRDIKVTSDFIYSNQRLVEFVGATLAGTAFSTPGAVDNDVREALDTLVRTYRTLQSGLYYETRPNNPVAAAIHVRMQEAITQFREQSVKEEGMTTIRDADLLGVLVFFEHQERQWNNGRRLGRAFLDFLRQQFRVEPEAQQESSGLLQP